MSLVGDGASLYSPQALWTAARERLPVTFVVMNNREYNVLKNFMKAQPHFLSIRTNRFIAMDLEDPPIDFPGARDLDGPSVAAHRSGTGHRGCGRRGYRVRPPEPDRDPHCGDVSPCNDFPTVEPWP